MKKILLSLILMAFAATTMTAQTATQPAAQVKKECCKDKKMDGKKCDKPADQQCDDCKKAEGMKHECKEGMKDCKKAEGMKHECKEGMKDCKKAEGMKHECKEGMKDCKKAEGMKHECKEGMKDCKKAEGMKHECKKEGMKKHQECKDHKDGQPCNKPADQQCPDCKQKAKKN